MKYIVDTLKYLKSNLLLLPALAVAIVACVPLINYDAMHVISQSFTNGVTDSDFADWFFLFFPINMQDWSMALISAASYIVLALDLAFVHSMVDKHVRFGTKSFRSIMSSMTINFMYALACVLLIFVCYALFSLLLALIMFTFAHIAPYVIFAGMVICILLMIGLMFIAGHFFLWLPCVEITGYRIFEAISYSYALARYRRWRIFAAIIIPTVIAVAVSYTVTVFAEAAVAYIIAPIFIGCLLTFLSVVSYIAYADADGIEREDLRKY